MPFASAVRGADLPPQWEAYRRALVVRPPHGQRELARVPPAWAGQGRDGHAAKLAGGTGGARDVTGEAAPSGTTLE